MRTFVIETDRLVFRLRINDGVVVDVNLCAIELLGRPQREAIAWITRRGGFWEEVPNAS